MIFRLSSKLAAKLKVKPDAVLPLDENAFADWSAHLFTAQRSQFLIVTNTASLYSVVMPGRGIAGFARFREQVLACLVEFMAADGQAFIYRRFIAPAGGEVQLSKALNRSVPSSMNNLIFQAKYWLTEGELSLHEIALRLNETPFSQFKYLHPREQLRSLM